MNTVPKELKKAIKSQVYLMVYKWKCGVSMRELESDFNMLHWLHARHTPEPGWFAELDLSTEDVMLIVNSKHHRYVIVRSTSPEVLEKAIGGVLANVKY